MKALPILILPCVTLLVSACGGGPGYGPGYGGPGYYGHDTVYVQGQDDVHRDYNDTRYTRNVTDVNDVNVNRTNVDERTVNRTNVNDKNRKTYSSHKPAKSEHKDDKNQQDQPHP